MLPAKINSHSSSIMASMEIKIVSFSSPNLFFFTKNSNFNKSVENLSCFMTKTGEPLSKVNIGDIIGLKYQGQMARGIIMEKGNNLEEESFTTIIYTCWLIDHAVSIKTAKFYRIPEEIGKIPPLCNPASLNNICYMVKDNPITATFSAPKPEISLNSIPSVNNKCMNLIINSDKIIFEPHADYGNFLVGELILHQSDNSIIYLTKELCDKKMVKIDREIFAQIKEKSIEFINARYLALNPSASLESEHIFEDVTKKNELDIPTDVSDSSEDEEIEDWRVKLPPMLNARRRRIVSQSTTKSESEFSVGKSVKSDTDELSSSISDKTTSNTTEKMKGNCSYSEEESRKSQNDWKMLMEFRKNNKPKILNGHGKIEEDRTTQHSINNLNEKPLDNGVKLKSNKNDKSKLAKYAGLLEPAGMRLVEKVNAKKKFSNGEMPKPYKNHHNSSPRHKSIKPNSNENHIPTMKINKEVKLHSKSSDSTESEEFSRRNQCTNNDVFKLMTNGCTCIKCKIGIEEEGWDIPNLVFQDDSNQSCVKSSKNEKESGIIVKPPPLLKCTASLNQKEAAVRIVSEKYNSMPKMQKEQSSIVLVHGESIPTPIEKFSDLSIPREIYRNIDAYEKAKPIQQYAFPAIARNQHVFLADDPKSGKSMAYLTILISFILEKHERYTGLIKLSGGPLVIILCSNSKTCQHIYNLTRTISYQVKCSLVTYPHFGNISNIDILITMPLVLSKLLSGHATNLKRLCHLVFEDADIILRNHKELTQKLLKCGDEVLKTRNCSKSIQLIMCAEQWTVDFEDIFKMLNKVPTVCIGNYLEAVLYGKIKFITKFLESTCKKDYIQKTLKDIYRYTKTIIVCNAEDIAELETYFILKGIIFKSFTGMDGIERMWEVEAQFSAATPGEYPVLICTDEQLNGSSITSATLLVHYSLPHSWTRFTKRFECLLENISSPLINSAKDNNNPLSSMILIDETCENKLAKFSNFMNFKNVSENVKQLFENVKIEKEKKRVVAAAELCYNLRLYGKCEDKRCHRRHTLDKNLDNSLNLPKSGFITFKILDLTTVTSCSVQLVEHFDIEGKSLGIIEDKANEINDLLKRIVDPQPVNSLVPNKMYLYKENDEYFRCQFMHTNESPVIYLTDQGTYSKSSLNKIFEMSDDRLQKFAPQSCEVYFANLIPPFNDCRFSGAAQKKAEKLVEKCSNSLMMGTILLQLGNNIWIDNVYEYRVVADKNSPKEGYQLTKELIREDLAVKSSKPLEKLYSLCDSVGIDLPCYKSKKSTIRAPLDDEIIEPEWAYLDVNAIHEITFTSAENAAELYIRQNKFSRQLLELEESIMKIIRKGVYTLRTPKVGTCCLVRDVVEEKYLRGYILSIKENEAKVLCVDYGDILYEELSELRFIPKDIIAKLPFQSIQCSMHGIKTVIEESSNARQLFYKISIDDSGFLKPLYIKIIRQQKNAIIPRQNSYSVLLKDSAGKQLLINNLLMDCGFCVENGEEFKDFELPEIINDQKNQDDEYYDDESSDMGFSAYEEDELIASLIENSCPQIKQSPRIVEIEKDKSNGHLAKRTDKLEQIKVAPTNLLAIENGNSDKLPPIPTASTFSDYLIPDVIWHQTDELIKLKISIPDVTNASIEILHFRKFEFHTKKEGYPRPYNLSFILFGKVEKTLQYSIFGSHVQVTMKKLNPSKWPRLPYTKDRMCNFHLDYSATKYETDDEENGKSKKMLQLNISDDSSDEDQRPYFVCSERESDYDLEAPNDELKLC